MDPAVFQCIQKVFRPYEICDEATLQQLQARVCWGLMLSTHGLGDFLLSFFANPVKLSDVGGGGGLVDRCF